ncbi:hypothetical protein JWE21_29320, partial [Klebsiella pneumoniae]|nr:hypothetical protein [Klebsiella pneumoniae]
LDEGDDPFDEANWPKANPGLGICKRWDDMRRLAKKAKEQVAAHGDNDFAHLIKDVNDEQQALISTLKAGTSYIDYHIQFHQR